MRLSQKSQLLILIVSEILCRPALTYVHMFRLIVFRLKRIAKVMTRAMTTTLAKVSTRLLSRVFDMLNRLEVTLISKKMMVTYLNSRTSSADRACNRVSRSCMSALRLSRRRLTRLILVPISFRTAHSKATFFLPSRSHFYSSGRYCLSSPIDQPGWTVLCFSLSI